MRHVFTKSFLLVLAVFCAGELVVRVFFARGMSGRFDYGYHPTAGFQENADGSLDLVRAGGRRFFPQRFQQKRPDGVFRVMVVGDSVPRGRGTESAYSGKLREILKQRGVNAESWNLGVAGDGTGRGHIVLQQALRYQPSLVVLHLNNSNEYEDERDWRRAQEFKSWHPKNWLMKSLALRRVHEMKTERVFWEWLPDKIRAQPGVNDAEAELASAVDEKKIRGWQERVRENLAKDIAACRRAGVKLLVVTQARSGVDPAGRPVLDDHGLDELAKAVAAPDVLVLSMREVFSSTDFAPLYADGAHLHENGHEILAKAIAEKLNGWLPKK